MYRFIQAVFPLYIVCLVTLSYHIQLGKTQTDGNRSTVIEQLLPILYEMKNDLNSIRDTVDTLNERVSQQDVNIRSLNQTVTVLAGELEEHKNETTDGLQILLHNNPLMVETISKKVLHLLLPYLNTMEDDIKSDIGLLIDDIATCTMLSLSEEMKTHRNQTSSELAHLHSSINADLDCVKTELANAQSSINSDLSCIKADLSALQSSINSTYNAIDYKLTSVHDTCTMNDDIDFSETRIISMIDSINTDLSCVKTDLSHVINISSNLSEVIEVQSIRMSSEVAGLQTSFQSYFYRLIQLDGKMNTLQSTLNSVDIRMNEEFSSMESQYDSTINFELTLLDTRLDTLNTLISDDLNRVNITLSEISNATIELCDKIEEHETQTSTKLMDLEKLIYNNFDPNIQYIPNNDDGDIVCGGTSDWRRAAYMDMSDPRATCPCGWIMTNYEIRTCGRASGDGFSCDSVFFPVNGGEYSQVCGRIKAYQWGEASGFYQHIYYYVTVNDAYHTGVAVMHGIPRQHIWSFVAGQAENCTQLDSCPCDTYDNNILIPSFVGTDYFCESGYIWPGYYDRDSVYTFHSDDPLWDGDGCTTNSTCCSFNNPPYFIKSLDNPTTDDIELRMCNYHSLGYSNIAVEFVEIYVK